MSIKFYKIWNLLALILINALLANAQPGTTPANEKKPKETREALKTNPIAKGKSKQNIELIWNAPDPLESGKTVFASNEEQYEIKLTALANTKLKAQDFKIYINNKSLDGSKFEEGDLKVAKKARRGRYSHRYTGKLLLEKGINRIEIEVIAEDGTVKTYPIEIHYNPKRVNLHILAIGPEHANLQYTGKDAQDFAQAFNNQQDRLFKKVFIYQHAKAENTDQTSIKKAFYNLKHLYETEIEEKISDNDLLIIFISSHGQKDGRRFKIQTSGYNSFYADFHTIDYERDIIQYLKNINCKKLMFIDACHSGAAYADVGSKDIKDEDMARALHTLLESDPGLTTITSCQKHEKSYEDVAWRNGAFTEAILAAFANKQFKGLRPDADNDKIIELGELKDYIQAYVPFLVETQKPSAGTQVPHMTASQLPMNLPIYALDTYNHKNFEITSQRPAKSISSQVYNTPYEAENTRPPTTDNPDKYRHSSGMMDSDGDGISDELDHCPNHKGLPKNDGCPEARPIAKGPVSGTFKDRRDGQTYTWIRLKDGKKWMSQNLNYEVKKDSWCYNNKGKNCKTYGRLYTWNAAQRACPPGWRLPNNHDWDILKNYYGGEKAAYQALLAGGSSNFSAQLSGIRTSDNTFCCLGDFGNYWTKESSVSRASYADFNSHFNALNQETHDKNTGLSCRCVEE